MLKRSIALAFALVLGPAVLKAQDMGPFVKGRQFATMQEFDRAVVDWLLSKSSGKGEVALPTADGASRSRSVRAATVATGLSVSRYGAGYCRNHSAECLRAKDMVLAVYPVQNADVDKFMASYALIRRVSLQGHPQISDTVIHAYLVKTSQGIMVAGVITATTP
jgi:hypothetical protein